MTNCSKVVHLNVHLGLEVYQKGTTPRSRCTLLLVLGTHILPSGVSWWTFSMCVLKFLRWFDVNSQPSTLQWNSKIEKLQCQHGSNPMQTTNDETVALLLAHFSSPSRWTLIKFIIKIYCNCQRNVSSKKTWGVTVLRIYRNFDHFKQTNSSF